MQPTRIVSKVLIFLLSLLPFIKLIHGLFTNNLGANPVEYILHSTGFWTLTFLLITLTITPLRKQKGLNNLIQYRRMLGLYAFFYAFLHFGIYLGIDRFFVWNEIIKDITERPYITVGFTAFILLFPLALTSTKKSIKKLGKRWQKLHRLIYVTAVLGVIHFWWLVKKDISEPLIFATVLSLLFLIRLFFLLKKRMKTTPR
jgi:sulfoxide reductase heme-binding subunit YedZ